jgi:predicted membrane-bound mannosyltransferase
LGVLYGARNALFAIFRATEVRHLRRLTVDITGWLLGLLCWMVKQALATQPLINYLAK